MGVQSNVAALKQQLEHLFPGKWVSGQARSKNLLTGLADLDQSLIRGLARQRITEWVGPVSSGKTSVLRTIIARWCASGYNVVYIDVGSKLNASDWAYVKEGQCGASFAGGTSPSAQSARGKFWVVRMNGGQRNSEVWAADQLIRSGEFDVVILDFGTASSSNNRTQKADRMAARLQRSLSQSRAALLVVRDGNEAESGWGCHVRLNCKWSSEVTCAYGASGTTQILPAVDGAIWKDGVSRPTKMVLTTNVANCLFTHPQVPDRRTPKA